MTEPNAAKYQPPLTFATDVLNVRLWSKQEEVLAALPDQQRVAVKSGNGLGKGFCAAVAVLWFLHCHEPAIVLSTAPTFRQVRHILWRQIRRLYRPKRDDLGGKMLDTRWELAEDRYAMGLSAESADEFQGFHSPNMFIVVDEAEGVGDEIYEAIEAIMTASEPRLLLIGNPTTVSGAFHRAFHQERHLYKTITISALDSPNVKEGKIMVPGLTSSKWVEERKETWGEENPIYRARVLGEFPDQAEDTLIRLSDIEAAAKDVVPQKASNEAAAKDMAPQNGPKALAAKKAATEAGTRELVNSNETANNLAPAILPADDVPADDESVDTSTGQQVGPDVKSEANPEVVLAVDVARFGSDRSVILRRRGNVVEEIRTFQGLDTMQLTGWVISAINESQPSRICVDEIGVGAGVVDRLKEQGHRVQGINVARRAGQYALFANLRAEGYWRLRELFSSSRISIPADNQLMGELAALRYGYDSQGRIQIESKDSMRQRGLPSPDKADALMLAFLDAPGRTRLWT